jgi:hypothetical protein
MKITKRQAEAMMRTARLLMQLARGVPGTGKNGQHKGMKLFCLYHGITRQTVLTALNGQNAGTRIKALWVEWQKTHAYNEDKYPYLREAAKEMGMRHTALYQILEGKKPRPGRASALNDYHRIASRLEGGRG